jgi:outer membrane protein
MSSRITLTVVLCFVATAIINAQPKADGNTTHSLTAVQAVELALKQRTEILNAQIDIRNQEAMNREITGSALPQIKGTGSVQKNFLMPVTVLPDFISPSVYGVLTQEGVKDGNGNTIQMPTNFATFPAQFGVPWQAALGGSVQQLLFQPDVFIGLKARKSSLELYENQLKIQKDSVKSNVYRTYYGVLIAEKGLKFVKESEGRLQKLLADQKVMFENGFIERLDLEKTQVSLNNIHTSLIQLSNLVNVSYAGLKFALGLPQHDSLVLVDTLTTESIQENILSIADNFKYEDRSDIQTVTTSNKLLGLQVKRYQLNGLPTIALGYNAQTSAQRQKFDFFDSKQKWFFSHGAGLNVSMNIFDGGQRRNRVKQARYALEKGENTLNQLKQVADLQIVASKTQLINAIDALNNQEENKALAEKVYNTTKIKYEQGIGSSFEVIQSQNDLTTALNNYYQALYNAAIAKIDYQKALGKL